jgi:glycosidase
MLNFTKQLITLRRQSSALNSGSYQTLDAPPGLFAYRRQHNDEKRTIVLNFTNSPQSWPLPDDIGETAVLLSTHHQTPAQIQNRKLPLQGSEGILL